MWSVTIIKITSGWFSALVGQPSALRLASKSPIQRATRPHCRQLIYTTTLVYTKWPICQPAAPIILEVSRKNRPPARHAPKLQETALPQSAEKRPNSVLRPQIASRCASCPGTGRHADADIMMLGPIRMQKQTPMALSQNEQLRNCWRKRWRKGGRQGASERRRRVCF